MAEPKTKSNRGNKLIKNTLEGSNEAAVTAPDYRPGLLKHIVLFRYAPSATPAQREEIDKRFHALAASIRNGERYIVSIESGVQNSHEGHHHGLQHGFIVTFKSEGDRNYYVGTPLIRNNRFYDAAHEDFKRFLAPHLDPTTPSVVVFDFTVS